MIRYPLKLIPVCKSAIWGGDRLKRAYGKTCDLSRLAETWELTLRQDCQNRIASGPAAGLTLGEYVEQAGNAVVSPDYDGSRFPLLIKFIDAADRLSVQVHPDDEYAARYESDPGKTEMWVVLEAAPGAELIAGLQDGITPELFAMAVDQGRTEAVLNRMPVKAGDVLFIPSGLLHAIGAGIVIAEIQQNSDLTYRVWDYNRPGLDGKPRQLHVEKALAVTRCFTQEQIEAIRYEAAPPAPGLLAACRYFRVRRTDPGPAFRFTVGDSSFVSVLVIDGEGTLTHGGTFYPLCKGDSYFLPAGIGACTLTGNVSTLLTSLN